MAKRGRIDSLFCLENLERTNDQGTSIKQFNIKHA